MIKKNIAITQRLILNDSYYELREALDIEWAALLQRLNFLPIVLPIKYDFEKYFETIDIGGILLTGGNDISIYKSSEISLQRDSFEKKLIDYGIKNDIPILGVCLGHQCIGYSFGGKIIRARTIMHGKISPICHNKKGVFRGIPSPFQATRYHSLIVDPKKLPAVLQITARTDSSDIMGVQHKKHPTFGIQFHPESVMTEHGHKLLNNFIKEAKKFWKKA